MPYPANPPSPEHTPHPFLAVIGGGNMGKAIVTGGVNAKLLSPARVCVAEHDDARRARIAALGVKVVPDARDALAWLQTSAPVPEGGQVLLAIKPQSLGALRVECAADQHRTTHERIIISILAGMRTPTIRQHLGGTCKVIRAMPNLPAAIGRGATALCVGEGAAENDASFADRLFRGVGSLVLRIDEGQMDAFTALAGSGPAYLFYLAEAMMKAGVAMGFSASDSAAITRATLAGSALMLDQSTHSAAELRAAVTSKGGTTQAATDLLDSQDVMNDIIRAVQAAAQRGQSLGT